jgi:hypothetical protein
MVMLQDHHVNALVQAIRQLAKKRLSHPQMTPQDMRAYISEISRVISADRKEKGLDRIPISSVMEFKPKAESGAVKELSSTPVIFARSNPQAAQCNRKEGYGK